MMLKEYIKEKLEKENVEFSFFDKEEEFYHYKATLRFPNGKTLGIEARESYGAFFIRPMKDCDFSTCTVEEQNYINYLKVFIEEFAEELECYNVFYLKSEFEQALDKNVISDHFSSSIYQYVDYSLAKSACFSFHRMHIKKSLWIKENKNSALCRSLSVPDDIVKFMKEFEKREPRFLLRDTTDLTFHFNGAEASVGVNVTETNVVLKNSKLNIKISLENNELLNEKLEEFFKKIKDRRRIKEMFEESSYFFDRVFYSVDTYSGGKKEIRDILLKKYKPIELEEKCAISYKNKELKQFQDDFGCSIISFAEEMFFIKNNEIFLHADISEKEKIMQHYETYIQGKLDASLEKLKKMF